MEFALGVLVAGMLLGVGLTIGVILYAWLFDRHRVKVEEMNRKAYMEARGIEVKRINAEWERVRKGRERTSEMPRTPEEEQKTYMESLLGIGYTQEEAEQMAKERRRM